MQKNLKAQRQNKHKNKRGAPWKRHSYRSYSRAEANKRSASSIRLKREKKQTKKHKMKTETNTANMKKQSLQNANRSKRRERYENFTNRGTWAPEARCWEARPCSLDWLLDRFGLGLLWKKVEFKLNLNKKQR